MQHHSALSVCQMKRTVPYFPKGQWVLGPNKPQGPLQLNGNTKQTINAPKNWQKLDLPQWKKQMFALREKFQDGGWKPQKKLSRAQISQLRATKKAYPSLTLNQLGKEFGVSPEAVRRILKSKFRSKEDKELEDE